MKKIAIVVAMQSEFDLVKNLIEDCRDAQGYEGICVVGSIGGKEVLLAKSGIGKVNAAVQVAEIAKSYAPDCIINSGVAGGIGSKISVGSIVVGSECVYHDVWCGEGAWGEVQGLPLKFPANNHLLSKLKEIEHTDIHYGLICTGDQFITESIRLKEILHHFPDGLAVDMESCAMAHVCYLKQIPFVSIRVISDTPFADHDNTQQYFDFWNEAPQRTFEVLHLLLNRL